jgi:hypothetical protein
MWQAYVRSATPGSRSPSLHANLGPGHDDQDPSAHDQEPRDRGAVQARRAARQGWLRLGVAVHEREAPRPAVPQADARPGELAPRGVHGPSCSATIRGSSRSTRPSRCSTATTSPTRWSWSWPRAAPSPTSSSATAPGPRRAPSPRSASCSARSTSCTAPARSTATSPRSTCSPAASRPCSSSATSA